MVGLGYDLLTIRAAEFARSEDRDVELLAHFAEQDPNRGEQRGSARRSLRLDIPGAASEVAVTIRDLSLTGVLIETAAALGVGEVFQIDLPEAGTIEATVVWNGGELYGCQFTWPISPAALSAALLKGEAKPAEPSALAEAVDILADLQGITADVQRIRAKVERSLRRFDDRDGE